jgi:N-acetylmuramoyl-L-alanine amidase
VLGEARGEGMDGMEAVAAVIRNRTNSGQFPNDPAAVALQPSQFSVWNAGAGGGKTDYNKNSDLYRKAEQAVERVFSGQAPDRTNGALYYHTPAVSPYWADEANQYGTTRLGNHIFYNGRPTPPGEIPNQVASLTDTVAPRVPPNPVAMSPDLSLMRNPQMSSSARMAQVTPPLPQPRPVSPMDIARAPGTTVATIPTSMRPGQSQIERITPMPSAREIAMAPGTTVATIPTTPRASLPAIPRTIPGQSQIERTMPSAREIASAPGTTIATIPTSGIGQPPATRTVPSVPYTLQPTAREIAQAPGVTVATIPTTPTQPMNMRSRDSVANAALGQRVATQMGPAFSQPSFIPDRLAPNPIVQPSFVPLNQPPIQVVPSALPSLASNVPLPRRRPATPIAPMRQAMPQQMPRMASQASPMARIVVNGAGSYSAPRPQPMTPMQSLMAQGMSQAQAYNALTQRAPTLEDRITGRTGLSSYSGTAQSLSS